MFTENEKNVISPYFTNTDGNVFCLTNLPEVVKGALFSRYSRSPKSLRRILLDEFVNNPDVSLTEIEHNTDHIAVQKAESFYDRILVGYGDDSVAELGGAHIALEGVSNIATKVLEDARIGISPLEKSTRYVRFDDKADGHYRFLRDGDIMSSKHADTYIDTCNMLFDTYSNLMNPVMKFVEEKNPRGEESERAYAATIRAKSCDLLRGLLPASTLTNLGLFGNGRAFEYLITKMHANPLSEIQSLASKMHEELSKVIPSFVKRVNNEHGKAHQKFIKNTHSGMENISKLIGNHSDSSQTVSLVDYGDETTSLAAMLYPHSDLSLNQLRDVVRNMKDEEKTSLIREYLYRRENRRHKPGRALENIHYGFDIIANYGAYRDLQRHRMMTQERQLLSTNHGYDIPPQLAEGGFDRGFVECMEAAKDAFERLSEMPKQAQYVVPMAYRIRWYMSMNLREAYFLCELRSSRQGHPDYRQIAQKIYLNIKEVHPNLARYMKFVDMKSYSLERLDAEKRQDKKLQESNDSINSVSVE